MNQTRMIDLIFLVAGTLVFLVLRQILDVLWDFFRLPLWGDWVIGPPDLLAIALSVVLFFVLKGNQTARTFMAEVIAELSKVTWPARKETLASAVIVIVMVGIASLILVLFDALWGSMTQRMLAG